MQHITEIPAIGMTFVADWFHSGPRIIINHLYIKGTSLHDITAVLLDDVTLTAKVSEYLSANFTFNNSQP